MTRQPGLPPYATQADFPELVWLAVERTRAANFPLPCLPEVGRLLKVLAAHQPQAHICELGSAYGVGAAWLASRARTGSKLLTVEIEPARAAAAAELFGGRPDI